MNQFAALETAFVVSAFVVCWVFLWVPFIEDLFRDRMFCLRDQLFQLAASEDNNLTFRSGAYQECRNDINHQIRHCQNLSPWSIVLYTLIGKRIVRGTSMAKSPLDDMSGLDECVKGALDDMEWRKLVIWSSYAKWIAPFGYLALRLISLLRKGKRTIGKWVEEKAAADEAAEGALRIA